MKNYVIPVTIPDSRDKKDWIFDNQNIAKSDEKAVDKESLEKIIEKHLSKTENINDVEVAFLGADFTNLEENVQEELLGTLQKYVKDGRIKSIRVCIRPNNITKSKLKMLKKYKVKTIELEIHSCNEYILKKIGMNYNLDDIKRASKMIRFRGFRLGHQITIGLPESTKIDDINTAKMLLKLKTSTVSINPVLVIKNTPLEKEYQDKKYKPLAVVQALETCKELSKILNKKNVEILAIGFEPLDAEIVAGPFHPAFRQLVESGLWYDAILNKIKKLNTKVMEVEVTVNPQDVNNVVGYKQENISNLKELYDVDLIVTPDETIKQGKSKIEVTKTFEF